MTSCRQRRLNAQKAKMAVQSRWFVEILVDGEWVELLPGDPNTRTDTMKTIIKIIQDAGPIVDADPNMVEGEQLQWTFQVLSEGLWVQA